MSTITGQRTSGNIAASQRKVDMASAILAPELEPSETPLHQFSKSIQGRSKRAINQEFAWHNDGLRSAFDAVNHSGGYNTTDTAVVVDTGTLFLAEQLVHVPSTGEMLQVVSVATNTVTFNRGVAGTTPASLPDNTPLMIIGVAAQEGDTSPPARSDNPVKVTNYLQIFRTPVQASGSEMSSSNESDPHDWPWQQSKAAVEHKSSMERSFLFGAPGTTTGPDGLPLYFTGGLLHFLTQNNQDAGGTLTEDEWQTWVTTLFTHGGQTRTVFASAQLINVLNKFSTGKLQTFNGQDTYGVKVMELISAHGTITLVKHPMLTGATYGGYGVAVNFKQEKNPIMYRFLNGDGPGPSRDTKLLKNRQENDRDGQKDEWLTEGGLQVGAPSVGGVLTGVTG